ncbi:MAG: sugar ABC transporter permease [Treponema sp.]|nr:sugar ABC transporter permease [Treponema sp.]
MKGEVTSTTVLNKKKKWNEESKAGLLFVLPPIIGFFLFTAIPFVFSIYASFTSWDSMTDLTSLFRMDEIDRQYFYIGLKNYIELFTDVDFWKALFNTFFYMIGIPIGMLWAFALAASFNKTIPGVKAFRVIYYIPVVSSIVAVSLLWKWLYNGDFGLLNQFLKWAFNIKGPNWLENPKTVKPAIMAMTIWRGVGATALLYLGGLQNLPKSYFEAAVLDGASGFRIFRSITWPLMKPISFFIVVTGIINGAQMIVEPQIMAPTGGTDYSAGTIVFYIWQKAFGPADAKGFACAAAWVLAIIIFIVTAVQFKLSSSNDNYLE